MSVGASLCFSASLSVSVFPSWVWKKALSISVLGPSVSLTVCLCARNYTHTCTLCENGMSLSLCVFLLSDSSLVHADQGPTSCSTPAGQTAPRVDKNGVAAGQASLLKPNAQKGMKAERTDRTSLGNARRRRQTRDGSDRSDDAKGPQDALGASRRSRAS